MRWMVLAGLTGVVAGVCAGQTGRGWISGVVVEDGKKPVGAAWVSYARELWSAEKGGVYSEGVLTGADGTFRFEGLYAGRYMLCVQTAPSRGYVNTCGWTLLAPRVEVGASGGVGGVELKVEKGMAVEFRVRDAGRLLANPGSRGRGVVFYAALEGEQLTNVAEFGMREGEEQVYLMNVPHGVRVRARPAAKGLVVRDRAGRVVGVGGAEEVVGDRGVGVRRLEFVVEKGQ